jgi:hypothetical protein
VYLDNCSFNRPFDNLLHPLVRLEAQTKLLIQAEIAVGRLNLVWSFILDKENSDNPFEDKKAQIAHWKKIANVIVKPEPGILARTKELELLGIKTSDAMHIASAIMGGAEYFITTDKKLLNKSVSDITMINPMDFVRRYFDVG